MSLGQGKCHRLLNKTVTELIIDEFKAFVLPINGRETILDSLLFIYKRISET
jgi:hypothetical protein